MSTKTSEHGQAIIFIAIGLVALLAFLALAVDGGRVYAERRRLQGAADSAAMAAANAAANGATASQASAIALNQAGLNDVVDTDVAENTSQTVDVIVNNPPQHGQYAGDVNYYEVVVRTKQPASFTGVFKGGTTTVEAFAVSHVEQAKTVAKTSALQSLITSGAGINIGSGSTKTTVNLTGGDIFSNANVTKNSASVVNVTGGTVRSHGTWSNTTGVSPAPAQNQAAVSTGKIPMPACPTNHFTSNSYVNPTATTLSPGYYDHEIWLGVSGRSYKLNPGVYCLTNGLVVTSGANLTGKGVLLIMLNGELRFNTTGTVKLTRASSIQDSAGNEYGGMLAYGKPGASVLYEGYSFAPVISGPGTFSKAASGEVCSAGSATLLDTVFGRLLGRNLEKKLGCPTQSKEITLSGSSTSTYTGTVYSPDHECTLTGASTVTLNGTLICQTVTITGTTVNINSNPEQNYKLPPTVELSE
jgi:Flp pilus assembly protein TadG